MKRRSGWGILGSVLAGILWFTLAGSAPSFPISADAYEPDDSYTQATTISAGTTQADHNFHVPGDKDWIQFYATAGLPYEIETLNLGGNCDTVLELYDTNGSTLLAYNDDISPTDRASRITWTAPTSGLYYLRVRHFSSVFGDGTEYDVHLRAVRDAYEPDDTFAQASTITLLHIQADHNFHVAGDKDWIRFYAIATVAYEIDTLNLGPNCDTVMELYDTNGMTLIASDDDGGPGNASHIAWTAPANGMYYIRVYNWDANTYGDGTEYDVHLSGTCDGYEPDDSYAQASTLVGSIPARHNFHAEGDKDWAKFSAVTDVSYTIETLNLGPNCDTVLELYRTDGTTLITSDDDGGTDKASRIEWEAPANGVYYVRVRQFSSSIYGEGTEYDLRIVGPGTAYCPLVLSNY